ncbi:hypothetical protein GUA87_14390 [Sneathiella sp. P13V-1]|uniref:mitochondrial fission ELM1 family protein n=1 Tax=Sneathiella sp. P13V-1 TaxID=2697366 RepID=UPI00187B3FDC|nr:mitochondrial fission ELM1 family protein [Sneathiella sp. P13V-1]MBE7638042.1 hypothetical protein [Sneathiella sp. P13V-1]
MTTLSPNAVPAFEKENNACWVITDGSAGMENQCVGLAEAMGCIPIVKRIQTKKPWRWLPPQLWINPLGQLKSTGDQLEAPWPDLIITCGRQAIPMSIAIRRASKGKTFTVHIQSPNADISNFDLVVVPEHDKLRGNNVLVSKGSLTRINDAKLRDEKSKFLSELEGLQGPIYTVLVGGPNRCYDVTPDTMRLLCTRLENLHKQTSGHFLVTTSRRTGEDNEAILKETLTRLPHTLWDGTGANPYFAYLAAADAIIVTADSVNMICEAATAGKPVFVFELPGGNRKFNAFHQEMQKAGFTKPFSDNLLLWSPPKLDETNRIATEVLASFKKR